MAVHEEFLKKLGENITEKRKERGFTSKELGYRCEMEKSNLIAIEQGRVNVTVKTLVKIANALEIEVKELFEF